ncbi:unnamed protein product [Clavelina lepadiformis]|uniref:BED-type domain-containing protein n=1 Tax=Clavelina lepadiformis TaxID=159417 RepID=A0ABP0FWD4_CLALP
MELKENFSSVFWGKKEEIFEKIESSHGKNCFLCNLEIYENFHSSNENISNHFLKKHFKFAVEFEVKGRKGFSLPCRKQECLDRKSETEARRSHFHCPFCTHVFGRSTPQASTTEPMTSVIPTQASFYTSHDLCNLEPGFNLQNP